VSLGLDVISETDLRDALDVLVRLVESAGALVIFCGAVVAFVRFILMGLQRRNAEVFVPVRLGLGRFLALGLEFQLASDVLRTAISPSYTEIGQLAAVAAIRTALNFFLSREINEEREQVQADRAQQRQGSAAAGAATSPSAGGAAGLTGGGTPDAGPDSPGSSGALRRG